MSNVPCVFPFKFNDAIYNECLKDTEGFWCSTEVDKEGWHCAGSGKWGSCGPGCPGVNEGKDRKYEL